VSSSLDDDELEPDDVLDESAGSSGMTTSITGRGFFFAIVQFV